MLDFEIMDKALKIAWIKVPITPKYFFRLNKSLHLFETNCTFLN